MPRFIIEIAGPRNESAIFAPIGNERLRGRWNNAKVAHRNKSHGEAGEVLKELSLAVELIPGLFISLDTDRQSGSIIDPLGETAEGKQIQAKIKAVLDRFTSNPLDCGSTPRPTSSYPNLGVDGVKEWLFHMRSMLDGDSAKSVSGSATLPTIDEIRKMPGKRRRDPLNTGPQEAESEREMRHGHGLYRWADEVPEGRELVGAGVGGSGVGSVGSGAGGAGAGATGSTGSAGGGDAAKGGGKPSNS